MDSLRQLGYFAGITEGMDMFVSTAWAQDAAAAGGIGAQLFGFLPIILIFVIFYFLVLKPQNDEAKKHAKMVSELKKGDRVVTQGGIWGTITRLNDDLVEMEISQGVTVHVSRIAIVKVVTEAEAKNVSKPQNSAKKR